MCLQFRTFLFKQDIWINPGWIWIDQQISNSSLSTTSPESNLNQEKLKKCFHILITNTDLLITPPLAWTTELNNGYWAMSFVSHSLTILVVMAMITHLAPPSKSLLSENLPLSPSSTRHSRTFSLATYTLDLSEIGF